MYGQTIIEVDYLDGTPAKVNRRTGEVMISKYHFDKMDPVYADFVIAHEEGHYLLQTKDEQLADEYAMQKLLEEGKPLSKILQSLTRVLNYDKENHYGRTLNIFKKLVEYDYFINNNEKVVNNLMQLNMETPDLYNDIYAASFEGEYDNFLGIGKKASQRREEKHNMKMKDKEAKIKKKEAQAERIKAKGDFLRAKGEAIKDGTYKPQGIGETISGIVGGIFGKKSSANPDTVTPDVEVRSMENQKKENQKNDNTMKYILIGLGVIALAVVAYFIFFKKRKK